MKNINKTNKNSNRKLYILLAGMFATTVSAAPMHYSEKIEINTMNPNLIMSQAKAELETSLKNSSLNTVSAKATATKQLTLQAEHFNQHMTLTTAKRMAE
jgi:hypothetical protein